jgi:hypothetical protein
MLFRYSIFKWENAGAAIIGFVLFYLIIVFATKHPAPTIKQYVSNFSYFGRVEGKFLDSTGRYLEAVVVNGKSYVLFCHKLYDSVEPGDTLLKNKGETRYLLIRKADTTVFYVQQ